MAVWWSEHWVEVLGFVSGAACVLYALVSWRRVRTGEEAAAVA